MTSALPIPTVNEVLNRTRTSNGFHAWPVYGGSITVPEQVLRSCLEDAYDQYMPNWPTLVYIPFSD